MENSLDKGFRDLFKKAPIGYVLLDYDLNIKAYNKAFLHTLDERRKNILNSSFRNYISIDCISTFHKAIEDLIENRALTSVSIFMENGDKKFYANLSMDIIDLNEREYITCMIVNIDKEKKITEKLEYLSFHDELTGLYNRRFFEEELQRLDVKRNLPLTIVMADVNGLKVINDSFGHSIGDELLKIVADAFKRTCREDDIIARVGGDEFVILLPNTDEIGSQSIIDRIKGKLQEEKIFNFEVSVSFGSSTKYEVEESIGKIYKLSEDNMYRNKLIEGQDMRSRSIEKALLTLYLTNPYEAAHSRGVSFLIQKLAKELNYTDLTLEEVGKLGLIHDLGKIAIDKELLLKTGNLNKRELAKIKKHSEVGYHMLNSVYELRKMAKIVLHHHERWDGKGYPKGLKGEEIPLGSRILFVCETYDYLMRDMPYRKANRQEDVIQVLKGNRGTQFDPHIVDVFLKEVIM